MAVYFLTTPIQFGFYNSGKSLGKQFHFIYQARFAAQESKALKHQLAEILSENATLRTKLAETQTQLRQEQAIDPRTYQLLVARPIGLEKDRFLKIDKGLSDGVVVGQAVIFKDSFLGKTISVSEKNASIMLPTDPDSKVAAFSLNKDGKAKGVLTGQFGAEMILDKILHEEPITEGDLVYSEGTEGYLPRGLILGRVASVSEQKNQVFKIAKVKPVFDIRDLELVFLIQ